jgi:MFS family permease
VAAVDPREVLGRVGAALRTVLGSRPLRRVEIAFAAFNSAEWAVWIAMLVYAYGRGGTTEAGIVATVQLVPAAIVAPLAATLGDRRRPGRVLCAGYGLQSAALTATAIVLLADGPAVAAYAAAAVAASAVTITRPTMSALVPSLARTPDELTATNVVSSWIESLSVLVAPAVAGVLLALGSPGLVFAVMAVAVAVGAILVLPVPGPPAAGTGAASEPLRTALLGAARVLRSERPARLLVLLLCADFVALGALDVLYPQLAIGTLGLGEGWAGYLNAAFGAGAAAAVVVTAGLVGRRRLVPSMLWGLALYLVAFLLLAAFTTPVSALVLLALAGAGRVILDVAARTLLQRVAPADTLARIFGLLEGIAMAGLAVGSLVVAGLVAAGGVRAAILGIGLMLPLAALVSGRELLSIDRHATVPVVQIGLLRSMPLFAPLDPATLESLARSLVPAGAADGDVVVRQGEPGDRFYVIAAGTVRVERDGATVATLGRGEGFGEIALLRDVPRTASCLADGDVLLYALDKQSFLASLSHPAVGAEAERLATARSSPAVHVVGSDPDGV